MMLDNQAGKHHRAFDHLFLEFEHRLNVLNLVGRHVLTHIFLVGHQLSEAIDSIIEKADAIICDTCYALIEIADQIPDCFNQVCL